VREHQRLLTGLGSGWHTLYEFGVYQRALWELGQSVSTRNPALSAAAGALARPETGPLRCGG
jgi:hypothetical protein